MEPALRQQRVLKHATQPLGLERRLFVGTLQHSRRLYPSKSIRRCDGISLVGERPRNRYTKEFGPPLPFNAPYASVST